MKNIIIAISGRKCAGKDTSSSYLSEYIASKYDRVQVKKEAFANGVKDFCINTLGLSYEQCHGTNDDKNSNTEFHWNYMPSYISCREGNTPRNAFLTAREVMQVFGQLVRDVFGNVWAQSTINRVLKTSSEKDTCIHIITDTRYPNEIDAVLKNKHGFVIRLTRSPFGTSDQHFSECSLDNFDWERERCYVLDNKDMSIEEQNIYLEGIVSKIITYCLNN